MNRNDHLAVLPPLPLSTMILEQAGIVFALIFYAFRSLFSLAQMRMKCSIGVGTRRP